MNANSTCVLCNKKTGSSNSPGISFHVASFSVCYGGTLVRNQRGILYAATIQQTALILNPMFRLMFRHGLVTLRSFVVRILLAI